MYRNHYSLLASTLFMLAMLLLAAPRPIQAAAVTSNNGPNVVCPADSFGYTCADSNEPGILFNWIDISATGTNANLTDDSHLYPVPISFDFDFYGTPYNQAAIGSNGTVYFQNTYLTLSNGPIPGTNSSGVASLIAVYWDDLDPSAAGAIYYETRGTAPNRQFIVQFDGVPNFGTTANVTAQVILYEGSNNILIQHLDPSSEAGIGATVGIQGSTTTGVQYSYNTASLTSNLAICFQHPAATSGCGPVVWDGGGADNNWSTAENWSGDQVPGAGDTVVFDGTSSKDAAIDAAFTVDNLYVAAGYTGTINQTSPLVIADLYNHDSGTMIVSDGSPLTVGTTLNHTGGTLQQTRTVANASVAFLEITDGGANVHYRGVDVDTSSSGSDLGAVTVRVRRVDGVS
ncbi:MAG: hypothetical protein KC425_01755, partial [Anaerolineales bacterium]|nr:hypothetical protein [Anaerolineales bacterium]